MDEEFGGGWNGVEVLPLQLEMKVELQISFVPLSASLIPLLSDVTISLIPFLFVGSAA